MSSHDDLRDEITPPETYFNRRTFVRAGIVAGSAVLTGVAYRALNGMSTKVTKTRALEGLTTLSSDDALAAGFRVDEPPTALEKIAHYNNFYEFTTNKDGVADRAAD